MEPKIVHACPDYSTVELIEPTTLGYIHIAAEVAPRRAPFFPNSHEKTALLSRLKELGHDLERLESVERVTVFDAVVLPPPPNGYVKERQDSIHIARFDIVILIETTSPAVLRAVQATPAYQALLDALQSNARTMHIIDARNARRINDVVRRPRGLFLFNYFVADDAQVALRLWDYLADWYAKETGMDNSVLLLPMEGEPSDYRFINHARWDVGLLRFLWRQMSRKSFRNYVLANLEANHVGSMPIMYRLA